MPLEPLSPTIPANSYLPAFPAPIRQSEAGLAMGNMHVILSEILMSVPIPAFPMRRGLTRGVLVYSPGTQPLVMDHALEMLHASM